LNAGLTIRLSTARKSRLCGQLFEEFLGPGADEIRSADASALLAFVDWWGRRGLANWPDSNAATLVLNELWIKLDPSRLPRCLPWRLPGAAGVGPARLLEWWPAADGRASVFDSPVGVIGGDTDEKYGGQVQESLDALIDVAAAGGHNLTIVDRYAFKLKNRPRLESLVSRGAGVNRLMIMAESGEAADATSQVEVEAGVRHWRAQAARPDRPWLSVDPWGVLPRFNRAFHDRFVLVTAHDPACRFRGRQEVACLMLGTGLDALDDRRQPLSTVTRIPPDRCGEITRVVNTAIARNAGGARSNR